MLNQPFIAPTMVFEKRSVQPKETAFVQKAAAMSRGGRTGNVVVSSGGPPIKVVKQALEAQEERFKQKISGKEDVI